MSNEISKIFREISMRTEEGRIQVVNLVSSAWNRLNSLETKVIPTSKSHLLWGRP